MKDFVQLSAVDKMATLAILEALMEAHWKAGNLQRASEIYIRIVELLGLIPPQEVSDEPLWDVNRLRRRD